MRSIDIAAYELDFFNDLEMTFLIFHFCLSKIYVGHPTSIEPFESLGTVEGLSYEEVPIQIMD